MVVVRLKEAIRVREISNADPTGKDSFPPTKFFAVILGPPLHGASCIRHVEMGEALAALMQDEDVLKGFYGAETAMDVYGNFDSILDHFLLIAELPTPHHTRCVL